MPRPDLPRVILTTTATVDGRIALSRDSILLDPSTAERWASIQPESMDAVVAARRADHGASAILEGSGSFVLPGAPLPAFPAFHEPDEVLFTDWLPRHASQWFVVADGRGRVDWQFTGDETMALVVLVCRRTPAGYLQLLRERGIGYLVAGDDRVDLSIGLSKIKGTLGADPVVADSGGTMNASLLRSRLVDELDVVTLPGLVGGLGTPSMMDGDPLGPEDLPLRLELLSHEVHPGGVVRTRYRVLPVAHACRE